MGLASQVRYKGVWLSSGIPEVCCYVGLAKLCYEAMWLVREDFLRLAIWASKQIWVWNTWPTGGITSIGAGKLIRYDVKGLASEFLGVWLCGLIIRNM